MDSHSNKRKRNDDNTENYEHCNDEDECERVDTSKASKSNGRANGRPRSSEVWKYFTKTSHDTVACNFCGGVYKTGGGTTNMNKHLNKRHAEWQSLDSSDVSISQSQKEKPENGAEGYEVENITLELGEELLNVNKTEEHFLVEDESGDSAIRSGTSSKGSSKQLTIKDFYNVQDRFESGPSDEKITQNLLYMICVDNMSLNTTEKEGMKYFLSGFCPSYSPPSEKTICDLIKKKYSSVQAIVKESLKLIKRFAISAHIVTNSSKNFVVLTLYYIDENKSCVKSLCLGVRYAPGNICRELEEMRAIWEIPKMKIMSAVTKSSAGIVNGIKLFLSHTGGGDKCVPCFTHVLSSMVTEALESDPEIVELIENVKSIVSYFEHNALARDKLKKEQKKCGKNDETILYLNGIQEGVTIFDCLQRFVLMSSYVEKVLEDEQAPTMPTSADIDIIQEILLILQPFEQAAKETSGQYTSGSLIVPLINCMIKSLRRVELVYPLTIDVFNEMFTLIEERLHPLEKNRFLAAATVLDPRFKQIHFRSSVNASKAVTVVGKEITDILGAQASSSTFDSTISGKGDLWTEHDECAAEQSGDIKVPDELQLYLDMPLLGRNKDPIKYWADNKKVMPTTYEVAMKYLTVLGASVPSQKVVSTINERIQLKPDMVDKLVFLNSMEDEYWEL